MSLALLNQYMKFPLDSTQPTPLYDNGSHTIYWLGTLDDSAFHCNCYLIKDGDEAIIVDPGSHQYSKQIQQRVAQILPPEDISGLILCHQDPDVAASMIDWLEINPEVKIISSPRTNVLLPHYGRSDYTFYDVVENPIMTLPSGAELEFIKAPFLHSPGAFTTYDRDSKALFSGDIWAALDINWEMVVTDMQDHIPKMDLFHIDYMASNIAARGFVNHLNDKQIEAIMPQHGSIIHGEHVPIGIEYLEKLQCGTDLIYADLD